MVISETIFTYVKGGGGGGFSIVESIVAITKTELNIQYITASIHSATVSL